MDIGISELMEQLQGNWLLENEEQILEINGKELTVTTNAVPVKTTFELTKNLQLGNWQIKPLKHIPWARTFVVKVTPDSFMLYDFDPKTQVVMAARTKLLNPTRIFRYSRVGGTVAEDVEA